MGKITQALIIKKVSDKNGCKAMELAADKEVTLSVVKGSNDNRYDLWSDIEALVMDGKLIEIEYVLPQSDRVKSFLLPAGTDVKIKSGK